MDTLGSVSALLVIRTPPCRVSGESTESPRPCPGLPENSIVKITETNGRLVYQARALGSQATWNGKDYKGNQAASGIYLVIAEDDMKQEKVVAKIVLISK